MGTQIYTTSPSGIYRPFKAYALGNGEANAREFLINNYNDNMTFDELINLALRALKESIDDEATKDNIRLSWIKGETKKFHMADKPEVDKYLSLIN